MHGIPEQFGKDVFSLMLFVSIYFFPHHLVNFSEIIMSILVAQKSGPIYIDPEMVDSEEDEIVNYPVGGTGQSSNGVVSCWCCGFASCTVLVRCKTNLLRSHLTLLMLFY